MINPDLEVITTSRDNLQVRVVVLLSSAGALAEVSSVASRAALEIVDYPCWKLDQLDPETRFVPLSDRRIYEDLDSLATSPGYSEWLVLRGLDVPLSQIDEHQRAAFWYAMFQTFRKRPRGLVIVLQEQAELLISVAERTVAEQSGQLVRV